MDVLASENRRLESESKAARAALTTVEDTATTLRSAAARDREEFDAWKKRARVDRRQGSRDRSSSRRRPRERGRGEETGADSPSFASDVDRETTSRRRRRCRRRRRVIRALRRSGIFPRGGMGGATKSSSDGGGALRRHERRREENLGRFVRNLNPRSCTRPRWL